MWAPHDVVMLKFSDRSGSSGGGGELLFQISILLRLCRRLCLPEVSIGRRAAHLHPEPVEVVAVVGILAQEPLALLVGPASAVEMRAIGATLADDGGAQGAGKWLLTGVEWFILVRVDLGEWVPVGAILIILGIRVLVGPAPATGLPAALTAVPLTGPRRWIRSESWARRHHGVDLGRAGVGDVAIRRPRRPRLWVLWVHWTTANGEAPFAQTLIPDVG